MFPGAEKTMFNEQFIELHLHLEEWGGERADRKQTGDQIIN